MTREFKSFDINAVRYRREKLSDYIQIVPPSVQALTRERELFNRTHQVTSNNLFQLKNGMNATTSFGYINHQAESDKQTTTEYYQADADTTVIREGESSLFKQQQFSAEVRIEANEDTYNLTERLQADFSWLDKADGVSGSIPNTQDAYSPDKQLTNDLYLLKRFGNKFIIFTSYTFLQDHPQRMTVSYEDQTRNQRIAQRKLFSDNKIDYGFTIGQVTVSLAAGAKVMWRDMDSELTGTELEDNTEGISSMNYTQLYLTPKLEYTWGRLKSKLSMPVLFYHYRYKQEAGEKESPSTRVLFNPDLYIEYNFSARWAISAEGGMSSSPLRDSYFYPGYLMDSYRTLRKGYPVYDLTRNRYIRGSIEYKRPLDEFFTNASVEHDWTSLPYLTDQSISDGFIVASYQKGKYTSKQATPRRRKRVEGIRLLELLHLYRRYVHPRPLTPGAQRPAIAPHTVGMDTGAPHRSRPDRLDDTEIPVNLYEKRIVIGRRRATDAYLFLHSRPQLADYPHPETQCLIERRTLPQHGDR